MSSIDRFFIGENPPSFEEPGSDIEITPQLLLMAFGRENEFHTNAPLLMNWICHNRQACYQVNRIILEHGEKLCPMLREDVFTALSKGIRDHIGLGKGVFLATLMHMPERYARLNLSLWLRNDLVMDQVSTSLRQSALTNAMAQGKYSLVNDLVHWMERLGESVFVQTSLSNFGREEIRAAHLEVVFPEPIHVDMLCRHRAFQQAFHNAQQDESKTIIMKAIAAEIGAKDCSWKGILQRLSQRLSDLEYDSDTVRHRYKSVGEVVLKYLEAMDEPTRKAELIDDDMRIMAYKLGVGGAIADIKSTQHKREALNFDLSL